MKIQIAINKYKNTEYKEQIKILSTQYNDNDNIDQTYLKIQLLDSFFKSNDFFKSLNISDNSKTILKNRIKNIEGFVKNAITVSTDVEEAKITEALLEIIVSLSRRQIVDVLDGEINSLITRFTNIDVSIDIATYTLKINLILSTIKELEELCNIYPKITYNIKSILSDDNIIDNLELHVEMIKLLLEEIIQLKETVTHTLDALLAKENVLNNYDITSTITIDNIVDKINELYNSNDLYRDTIDKLNSDKTLENIRAFKTIITEDKIKIIELENKENYNAICNILYKITSKTIIVPNEKNTISITKDNDILKLSGGYFSQEIVIHDYFKDLPKELISEAKSTIINENIFKDITTNNVIVDPAGSAYVYNNWNGAGGLSAYIYNKINLNSQLGSMIPALSNIDLHKLFTDTNTPDAFYNSYTLKDPLPDTEELSSLTLQVTINIIHSIGPDFTDNNTKYLTYETFNKIYNDIYIVFKDHDNLDELRLVALSSGLFSGNYINEIAYITVLVYIKLFLKFKTGNKTVKMYVIKGDNNKDKNEFILFTKNSNQTLFELFKEIFDKINNLI